MTDRRSSLENWLREALSMQNFELTRASEDASFRQYYRVVSQGESYIVMDAPPEKEDCRPFLDVTERLLASGVNAPRVFAKNMAQGFLLLSDLGDELYLGHLDEKNADDLYADAIKALLLMQTRTPLERLPNYSASVLMEEMRLFPDWLLGVHLQLELTEKEKEELDAVFQFLIESAISQPQVFVHRDYHSRNLILNNDNPGVIDYQDALLGPVSYDLVSLLKDCYIKWPRARVEQWLGSYHKQLLEKTAIEMDRQEFHRRFDLMGVQRHLKASGIFARLCHRDKKSAYLADIPRTLSYIVDLDDDYPELEWLVELLHTTVLPGLANI